MVNEKGDLSGQSSAENPVGNPVGNSASVPAAERAPFLCHERQAEEATVELATRDAGTKSRRTDHAESLSASLRVSSTGVNIVDRENGDIIGRGTVTPEIAQVLLDRFRNHGTQQFPFVVVPAGASLDSVRRNNPFLFLAIVATMIFDNPFLQHQLGEEIEQQAFQRILLHADKSLDLLQGLLVYTAWYCHFYRRDKHQEFLLSQLCVTLAHELGIDEAERKRDNQCTQGSDQESSSSLTNAKMRALLGTYCISCFHMEYCCQSLTQLKEYITDELIQHFVRSQELGRRIVDTFSYDDLNNGEIRGELLITMASEAFIRDLHCLRLELAETLHENILFSLEFQVLCILINEVALHDELWNSHPDPASNFPSITRSKMLLSSLNSCKSFLHAFISYQNRDLYYLTVFIIPRLYYVFITLLKLVFLDFDNRGEDNSQQADQTTPESQNQPWHMMNIAQESDFFALASRVLQKFTAVATDFIGPEGQRDAMSNFASAMKILMTGYEKQMNEKQTTMVNAETAKMPDLEESSDTVVESTPYTSRGADNDDSNEVLDLSSVDQLSWDLSDNILWDEMLNTFSMLPFS
ncbi:hypothetical protein NA57DRAFT_53074 [Rhizodiscina lignyota]|uniref:Transcription factor domain-containing protein n=1 Tax=Rhizodiscina lignyota TaxID=1504668 RepID=A0A9P4ILY1_9PEZI|nr:hypothetical protein NA57DRAFT_53074 [Rhizodiscina lignyota]